MKWEKYGSEFGGEEWMLTSNGREIGVINRDGPVYRASLWDGTSYEFDGLSGAKIWLESKSRSQSVSSEEEGWQYSE